MATFRHVRIGDIGDIITGKTPKTSDITNYGADYMFIGPGDLHQNFIITKSVKRISKKGLESIKGCILHRLSIVVGCIGWDMGNVALIQEKCATNQQINSVTNVKEDFNPYYIYYWLKSKKKYLFQIANVTRTPILNKSDFSNIIINVPNKINQDRVAYFLKSLDTKIELNNRINRELEGMAKLLYDYWFVQFDFPISEEQAIAMGKPELKGKPYKSSGGPMVYNEQLKRKIPEGWGVKKLKDVCHNYDSRRIPISKQKREKIRGEIPYFGATGIMDYINDYLFDKKLILVAEDGSVINKKGQLIVQFIYGKTWVNNHAHVLEAYKDINNEYLYQYLKATPAVNVVTGSIQKKVTQDNLNNLKVIVPSSDILNKFYTLTNTIRDKLIVNNRQKQYLINLRDWLLPMLMNGQVRVFSEPKEEFRNEGEVLMVAEDKIKCM